MKAFIVLALVAVAASRSVDLDMYRMKSMYPSDSSLFQKERLWSDKLSRVHVPRRSFDFDFTHSSVFPYGDDSTSTEFDSNTWANRHVTILSLEELMAQPLFREYMRIPLFQQFWEQYPTVFQKYVESPLFQQFWTLPQFQQYFMNPTYFYKYIVPQIQIVAQTEQQTPFGYGYNHESNNIFGTRRQSVLGDYFNKIFSTRTARYTNPDVSSQYGYNTQIPTFGRNYLNKETNYKFLLEKMYRTLFVNKPVYGETTKVVTDVKIVPAHKEIRENPITGEMKVVFEEPKIVDVKVDQKIVPNNKIQTREFETETEKIVKENILKRLVINKHITHEMYSVLKTLPLHHVEEIARKLVKDVAFNFDSDVQTFPTRRFDGEMDLSSERIQSLEFETETEKMVKESLLKHLLISKHITHEMYTVLKTLPIHKVKEIVRKMVKDVSYNMDFDVKTFPTRRWDGQVDVSAEDVNDIIYRHKVNPFHSQWNNIDNEFVGDRYTPVVRDLMKVLGQRNVQY